MNHRVLGITVFGGMTALVLAAGCGSSSDSGTSGTTTAASTATSSTTSSSGGGAGGDASTTNGAGGSGSTASGAGGAGGGGSSLCLPMGNNATCAACAQKNCAKQALDCSDNSTCDSQGKVTGGCYALAECAITKCMGDIACVATMCGQELASAGGIAGKGTAAAQALGTCIQANCAKDCAAK